jgi:hypothetical protein
LFLLSRLGVKRPFFALAFALPFLRLTGGLLYIARMEPQAPSLTSRVAFPLRAFLGAACWMLIGVAAGGFFLFASVEGILQGLRSSSWPTARGRISESHFKSSSSSRGGPSGVVRFAYEVDGHWYESDRVTAASSSASADALSRYRVGTPVTVYYDRSDPEWAVLEPGVRQDSFILALFGLAIILGWGLFIAHHFWSGIEPWWTARARQRDGRG